MSAKFNAVSSTSSFKLDADVTSQHRTDTKLETEPAMAQLLNNISIALTTHLEKNSPVTEHLEKYG